MKTPKNKWILTTVVIFSLCSGIFTSWSPWSDYTQCSRSCGGGVRYRERLCVVDRLDRPVCKGKKRIYKLCNTQTCDGEAQDFRAEQCQKYNSQPLDGVLYNWRPYYGRWTGWNDMSSKLLFFSRNGETCELLCFADGFPFFHKLADKVIDGTPCLQSNDRVCVDGQCKTVGCDMKIGSRKVLDVCGICGGDNSTCTQTGDINGIFAVQQLPPGYSTVVEIPAGARDIQIREMAENKNSIVFWDSSGENFAIDKDTRRKLPSVMLAGAHFNYKPEDKKNTFGRVQAAGPTLRKITVYAVNEGEANPGIRYSYMLPKIDPKFQRNTSQSQFGQEDKKLTDTGKTLLKPSNIRVSTSHVPSNRRSYGQTNVRVVDRRHRPGYSDTKKFGVKTDDNNENKKQFVYQNAIQVLGGETSITDNVYGEVEKERQGKKGRGETAGEDSFEYYVANEIRYGTDIEDGHRDRMELESWGRGTSSQVYGDKRYMWSHGQWTECSNKCGSGYQRRIVSCIDRERRESVDQEYCDLDTRPANSRRCNNGDCQADPSSSYVRWQVGEWGPCSKSCELGDQVQHVFCEAVYDDSTTNQVDDELCLNQYRAKPQYRRSCNDGVSCRGHSAMWMFSKWSQCSVTCGSGVQQRSVNCRSKSDQRQVLREAACNADIKPVSMRRCVMGVCPPSRQRERPDRTQGCQNTYYGCCPDGVTAARGARGAGCPRASVDQTLVRVGGRQILRCARLPEQHRETTYILEWTKQGQATPVYKQYRWRWASYQTAEPEVNPNFKGRVRMLDETSLEISKAVESDSGLYTCTLLVPLSRSDSRKYSSQVFLDVRGAYFPRRQTKENIVITEDDSSNSNRVSPGSTSSLATCKQPSYQGKCRDFKVKWYYNSSTETCDRFWYGGCDGNDNRFDNENDCRRACSQGRAPEPEEDVCKQPSVTGRCRARHMRWYYNSNREECLQFVYGGCNGNDNRFRTRADCERRCLAGTEALGDQQNDCRRSRFGCCPDGVTAARGNNNEGCPNACKATLYGCCDDELTAAQGPNQEGCDELEGSGIPCNDTGYGCCPDGVTAATGPNEEGCDIFIVDPQPKTDTDVDITVDGPDHTGTDVPVQCHLDKNTGPCKDYTVMWYYNMRENECDRFWFGGCEGNTNRFKSKKECLTTCQNVVVVREPGPQVPLCEQPKEIGPCRAALPRWFHNPRTRTCEQFFYGGCQGNDNNFERQDECERRCGVARERPLTAKEVCAQPQATGPCRASIPRYYYNAETKRCEEFTYGGCGGNRNNFETETQCRQYCRAEVPTRTTETRTRQPVCELTPDVGPCDRMVTKYFYNITTLKCEPFTYGGCLGNHNNFETEDKCTSYCSLRPGRDRKDDCQLNQEVGTCRGNIRRYYYDAQQGRCFPFTYGGCQGNRNNFADDRSCMAACQDVRVDRPVTRYPSRVKPGYCPLAREGEGSTCQVECSQDYECSDSMKCCKNACGGGICTSPLADEPKQKVSDVCSLPLQTPCSRRDSGPFWYYEKLSGQCKEVPNGDCNDNQNNFRSQAECDAYCSRERVCRPLTYESDIRCLAYMEHWTYNADTGACEMFVYGGCGGTANNFDSQDACNRKCLGQVVEPPVTRAPEPASAGEICAMAEDSGNCLAYIRNWRYDSLTGKCIQFTYGGCGGNANNFQSREECEAFCPRNVVCQKNEDPEIGCLAYMRRWRYEPSTRACENFIYGGCGGNANNFETLEACEGKCLAREPEREDNRGTNNRVSSWREICLLQADVGPCKQYIKRWHYNSVSQGCDEFTYGGCLGNHNNFESQEQCRTYCDSSRWYNRERVATTAEPDIHIEESSGEIPTVQPATGVDVCHLESYTGRCRAYIRSWYYDYLNGECKQFIYGGCDTNGNRFDTREECEAQCSPREVCLQPKRAGNCMASVQRFYFDYSAQKCKEFVYGGCDGNANSFETKDACERRCQPLMRDRAPPVYDKRGTCPSFRGLSRNRRCIEQCRSDRDCPGSEKCCIVACSRVCIEPEAREIRRPAVKTGFCPARTDWQGLLGACAPTCQDDSTCPGNQKCCHHGCGLRCIDPVSKVKDNRRLPDEMAPERIYANTISNDAIHLTWYDPSLGRDQKIRDSRYYTIRYYSYGLGQYEYLNTTDLRGHVNGLRPDTEYEFNVRVNDPPYLSEWSDNARNRTRQLVILKAGECPVIESDTFGICVEECQNDGECGGSQKCCNNGCGQTCMNPLGYDICSLPKDPGSCSDWEVRWYFNTEIQRCDRFWYGGCNEGNANNFMDEPECQSKCTETQITTPPPRTERPPYDCRRTTYRCCLDGRTPRLDAQGSNCLEYEGDRQTGGETIVPAIPGKSVTLTCRYGNNVTWYREGKLVESNSRRRVNPDGTVEVFSATIEDDGMYACHVAGRSGRPTIYQYMLQVQVPIGILPGPDKIMVKPNRQAFLHCEVYGNPKPRVSWQKSLTDIRSGGHYETFSNGTLLIRRATEEDIDSYTCTADNGVSTPVQKTIKLELREMLVARIENDNGRVMEGGRIKLTCEGRGYPVPTITWEKMGRPLTTGGNVFISSDGQLTIRDVTTRDTGTYSCIVANTEEKIETSTSVQVVPKVMPDDKCEDRTSLMKCRLIVTARLCGYTMYSKICCASCRRHFNGE
ncbi:papilin-like [Mercenaria mercenaria]|uniref:papilin-like n=1 Tax=Mercenaria mercenaria TaxID=6596 RepID=UPI00234EABD2|nr:papilin-like [Mercenaria mercenaria]